MLHKQIILSTLMCGLAAGCGTVGPDYAGPPAMATGAGFAREGGTSSNLAVATWWSTLGDPMLDRLLDRALTSNPTLAVAQARLRQARAALRTQRANQQPKGQASMLYAHARLPSASGSANDGDSQAISLDLYDVGFDASWEIDLFGAQRRAVEAASALAQSMEAELADAQVSLTAELVQTYVNLRSCQQRLALGQAAVSRQQQMLELTQRRRHAGTASELDVVRLQGQLESTRADTESLVADIDVHRDALAILLGQPPGSLDAELAGAAPVPLPPADVAVGDPAVLLRSRPDIRAAERNLAARTAQIGQAEAGRFPRLTFMGLIGIGGTRPADLTRLDDFIALGAPQLSWNVLDFGRSAANIDKANGARDEAEARYRSVVLAAIRDAEDALSRFRQHRISVATRARAQQAAERAANLMRERQRAGTATVMDLLDAERVALGAEQNSALANAALTSDYVSLHKALGLGWAQAASQ